ncbi:hypothetical protein [Phenylobacterium sp.]|uniref:hypothetical protein n=1 Tax=Phenylobacterium sp. TaxID=1871053 RepID=UPI00356780FD
MPTRKDVLRGVAALSLASSPPLRGVARAAVAGGFSDRITQHLPSPDQLWAWQTQLAAWAPCLTGGASHVAWINWLEGRLKAAGIAPRRQTFRFPYWQPHSFGLWLDGQSVPATGYRPYSGPTGPDGITAEMVYAGRAPDLDLRGAAGKIVLLHVARSGEPTGGEPTALFSGITVPDKKLIEASGAKAVVYIWNGFSDANAQWQMEPFFGGPTPVPSLWVGQATGEHLRSAAAKGGKLKLVLDATVRPGTPSDTLWGVLPGAGEEVVVVNTHTDGCNAMEENGGLAVTALALALSRLPQAQRKKTYVFLMTTGHFSQGYIDGADAWQKANPALMARTVACLTCEHLGAREWRDVGGVYRHTGQFALGRAFAWTKPMAKLFNQAVAATQASRMEAADPADNPTHWFPGEGSPFWRAGVPTVGYIPLPEYLMAQPPKGGEIEKLDRARLHQEIVVFARTLERLDGMSKAEIRG